MSTMDPAQRAVFEAAMKKLADSGRLVEAGFIGLRIGVIPPTASQAQLNDMRMAYMAGAQHLFSSLMSIMDSDREPTEADMRRMTLIAAELKAFEAELLAKTNKGKPQH